MSLFKENAIQQLIDDICKQNGIDHIVTLGSSKGGTCSLIYGLDVGADIIISGSPQFYLGKYLNACDYHKKVLKRIVDAKNGYPSSFLDTILPDRIEKHNHDPRIILIYSSIEGDYNSHILPLIDALKKSYNTNFLDCGFSQHGEIGNAMKTFIQNNLKDLV